MKTATEPSMDLHTLLTLLRIAASPDTRALRWQPMPDHVTGTYYEMQTLRLNEICERVIPYIATIAGWRNELTAKQMELDLAKERVVHLERLLAMYYPSINSEDDQ